LKKQLTLLPTDIDPAPLATAKIRRKVAIKTMETMTTLLEGVSGDLAGLGDDDDMGFGTGFSAGHTDYDEDGNPVAPGMKGKKSKKNKIRDYDR
jgi:hypothetical protein